MKKKVRVGVLFGGKSAEHEISLLSARNVVESIDREKYDVVLIGVDKMGQWSLSDGTRLLQDPNSDWLPALKEGSEEEGVALVPTSGGGELLRTSDRGAVPPVDVIFPVLHGPFGEDGTVQGLLKLADIPFVGASVLGSAVAMDKDVMKRLLRDAGVSIPAFLAVTRLQRSDLSYSAVADQLGLLFFVKPANLGSSVGISKVHEEGEFLPAIADAFAYDEKILIEENISGREIECSVLGNEDPIASGLGEIVSTWRDGTHSLLGAGVVWARPWPSVSLSMGRTWPSWTSTRIRRAASLTRSKAWACHRSATGAAAGRSVPATSRGCCHLSPGAPCLDSIGCGADRRAWPTAWR